MTFEDFLEDSQISYSTIETKEDLKRVIEKAWNAAIKESMKIVGAFTGDNTPELKTLKKLLT